MRSDSQSPERRHVTVVSASMQREARESSCCGSSLGPQLRAGWCIQAQAWLLLPWEGQSTQLLLLALLLLLLLLLLALLALLALLLLLLVRRLQPMLPHLLLSSLRWLLRRSCSKHFQGCLLLLRMPLLWLLLLWLLLLWLLLLGLLLLWLLLLGLLLLSIGTCQ